MLAEGIQLAAHHQPFLLQKWLDDASSAKSHSEHNAACRRNFKYLGALSSSLLSMSICHWRVQECWRCKPEVEAYTACVQQMRQSKANLAAR